MTTTSRPKSIAKGFSRSESDQRSLHLALHCSPKESAVQEGLNRLEFAGDDSPSTGFFFFFFSSDSEK